MLLDNMMKNDLALKGNLGDVELMIFPSNLLPEKSQRKSYHIFIWCIVNVVLDDWCLMSITHSLLPLCCLHLFMFFLPYLIER